GGRLEADSPYLGIRIPQQPQHSRSEVGGMSTLLRSQVPQLARGRQTRRGLPFGLEGPQSFVARRSKIHGNYFTSVPGFTAPGSTSESSLPPEPAANSIPWERIPRTVFGFRFANTTTVRPITCSGRYASAMPATIVRGEVSPKSIVSLRTLSA